MDSMKTEVADECLPYFQIYRDGRVKRLMGTDYLPPSIDSETGVSSKDIMVVPETGVSARLYLPKICNNEKLPLLIYFHGGAFCAESAFNAKYHDYLNSLVAMANVVAVSVEYRLAPEHPLPSAFDDCWDAIQWVISHSKGEGPEIWLKDYADFDKLFLAGDSAGAITTHHMAIKAGNVGVKLLGAVVDQPYFMGEEATKSEITYADMHAGTSRLWRHICPSATGKDDPYINPFAVGAPSLSGLGCSQVLVLITEKDPARDRGWRYYETLAKSGWDGVVEIMETKGDGHGFQLINHPTCEEAKKSMKRFASFLNKDCKSLSSA